MEYAKLVFTVQRSKSERVKKDRMRMKERENYISGRRCRASVVSSRRVIRCVTGTSTTEAEINGVLRELTPPINESKRILARKSHYLQSSLPLCHALTWWEFSANLAAGMLKSYPAVNPQILFSSGIQRQRFVIKIVLLKIINFEISLLADISQFVP